MTECTVRVPLPNGGGLVTLELFEKDKRMICCIKQVEGYLDERPRQWLRTVRAELVKIEKIAREAGCNEMQLRGRDWSRVLPDYTPLDGFENGLRKEI